MQKLYAQRLISVKAGNIPVPLSRFAPEPSNTKREIGRIKFYERAFDCGKIQVKKSKSKKENRQGAVYLTTEKFRTNSSPVNLEKASSLNTK